MRFVSYLRVSDIKQGQSGLGIEAQRASVLAFAKGGEIMREFKEVETGTNKRERPELALALAYARKMKATLIIAKLDRLARNVHFVSGLMEAKVDFIACDMPQANKLTIHIMAAMAEHEAEMISERTKAALKAVKARGTKLGGGDHHYKARAAWTLQAGDRKAKVQPIIEQIQAAGISTLAGIAGALNARGVKTPRGGEWSAKQVSRVLA